MPCGQVYLNLLSQVGILSRGLCLAVRLLHPLCAMTIPFKVALAQDAKPITHTAGLSGYYHNPITPASSVVLPKNEPQLLVELPN